MKSFATLMKTWALVGICVGLTAAGGIAAGPQQKPAAGPFATKAKVVVKTKNDGKVIPLKREEQIAVMFVLAIDSLEFDCERLAAEPCTLEALIRGPRPKAYYPVGKLKFDPKTTDPNYTYKVDAGRPWEVWANPRKPGLGGFYIRHGATPELWYNPAGPATKKDQRIGDASIQGDSFRGS
jgi:hypothetical protein